MQLMPELGSGVERLLKKASIHLIESSKRNIRSVMTWVLQNIGCTTAMAGTM